MLQDKEEQTQSTFKREKTVMDSSIKKKESEVEALHVCGSLFGLKEYSYASCPGKSILVDNQS